MHLTNQCVQKASGDYDTCDEIECNMWSREQFASHLHAERGDDDGAAAAAAVDTAIRDHVTVAMRSVADVAEARLGRVSDREQRRTHGARPSNINPRFTPSVQARAASFELFGFDFLIDETLKVWLLEANSSPDMSRNAPVLAKIVEEATDDLFEIVLDAQRGGNLAKRHERMKEERAARTDPCWELAHRGKLVNEKKLHRRFWAKKMVADSPQELRHHAVLRAWLTNARPPADAVAAAAEPPPPKPRRSSWGPPPPRRSPKSGVFRR